MIFPTDAQALALGFIKALPTSATLYKHPSLPNLLFKRVPDLKSVVACGGMLLCDSGDATTLNGLLTGGRTLVAQYNQNKFGHMCVPALHALGPASDGGKMISVAGFSVGSASFSRIAIPSLLSIQRADWYPFSSSSAFVFAVITKCVDMCAVRSVEPRIYDSPEFLVNSTADRGTGGYAMPNHMFIEAYNTDLHHARTTVSDSTWNGFMDTGLDVDLSAMMKSRKPKFLEGMSKEVAAKYSICFDKIIALDKYSKAKSQHTLRLHFTAIGTLSFVPRRPQMIVLQAANTSFSQLHQWIPFTVYAADEARRVAESTSLIPMTCPSPFDIASTGVMLPCVFVISETVCGQKPAVNASVSFPDIHLTTDAVKLAVPYKVSFNGNVVDAGDVFSSLSPLFPKIESAVVFSFDDNVLGELRRLSNLEGSTRPTLATNDPGATPEQNAATSATGMVGERTRRALVAKISPSLSPTTRQVVDFVNEVDELVLIE